MEEIISISIFVVIFGVLVIAISTFIPVYGYLRRRWKGLAIGCLVQPVVCAALIGAAVAGAFFFHDQKSEREKNSAMVTVKSIEKNTNDTDTLTWYLKTDGECLLDCDDADDRFDVIRLDSLSAGVSVEDRIVVRFDIKNQKASATDFDQPAEVLDVNWEKVKDYFGK